MPQVLDGPYLFQTPQGYVLRCACCGRFEIGLGRLLLQLAPDQFFDLCRRIANVPWEAWEPDSLCLLSLTGRAEAAEVRYAFSRTELMALRELLEGAQAMLELEALLRQTLQPS